MLDAELELMRTLWEQDIIDRAKQLRREKIKVKKADVCPQCGNSDRYSVAQVGVWTMEKCGACDHFDRKQICED